MPDVVECGCCGDRSEGYTMCRTCFRTEQAYAARARTREILEGLANNSDKFDFLTGVEVNGWYAAMDWILKQYPSGSGKSSS